MPNPKKLRPTCTNECGRRVSTNEARYCSFRCMHEFYRKSVIKRWKEGTLAPRILFSPIVRQYLLEIMNERCQRCGWSGRNPYSGKSTLEVEHIDGNWQNNAPSNITLLCPNCHSLTATFRGLNRGNGRPGRPGHRLGKPAANAARPGPTHYQRKPLVPVDRQIALLANRAS